MWSLFPSLWYNCGISNHRWKHSKTHVSGLPLVWHAFKIVIFALSGRCGWSPIDSSDIKNSDLIQLYATRSRLKEPNITFILVLVLLQIYLKSFDLNVIKLTKLFRPNISAVNRVNYEWLQSSTWPKKGSSISCISIIIMDTNLISRRAAPYFSTIDHGDWRIC